MSCFWMGRGRVDVVFNNKVRGLDRIIQVTVCWDHILSGRRLPIRPPEPPSVQQVYFAPQCAVAQQHHIRITEDVQLIECEIATLTIVLLPEQFIVISLITNSQLRFSLHFTPPTYSECRGLPKTS